jgi:hypothetical protein
MFGSQSRREDVEERAYHGVEQRRTEISSEGARSGQPRHEEALISRGIDLRSRSLRCYPLLNPIVHYLRNSGQLPHGTLRARFLSGVPPFSPAYRMFIACNSYRSVARS